MFLLSWIKRHLPESILVLIVSLLCLGNFTQNTFLTGWDNLMPELNISLNLKRSLFAVWQEYQGLGLVGGMAHASDLIRQLIILPLTLFLPTNIIRYLWHFSMLFLGTFGIYKLARNYKFSRPISLTSSLFYLLNFGSIQYFWVAFEPFSTFWGFFPWLIFFLLKYLLTPSKSHLKKLILINILAIPSFYVQTIFVVYLICISLVFLSHFLTHPKISHLLNYSSIFLIIFLVNSFWLLPQLYFLKNNLQNPTTGIGNFMSNDETFARNQVRGNLEDFLLLRGYYYDFNSNGQPLMAPWITHFSNQYFVICGYFISLFIISGLLILLIKSQKNNTFSLSLILLFFLSCLALLSNVPLIKELNSHIREIPLINQIFRSPWTKFLVPVSFTFSFLIANSLTSLVKFLRQIKYSHQTSNLPIYLTLLSLFIFSFPSFFGNYFSQDTRQKIPDEYFEVFNFLKTQNHTGRIANLPQGSFWGWTNYKWGISGSGFLWYALENPILDRAFDAWNLKNEQYYWELSNAIQSKNPNLLENIFSKYSIEYVIFDNNIYYPDDKIYAKLSRPTKDLLDSIPSLKLIKNTKNIFVYQTSSPTQIYTVPNTPTASQFDFALIDTNYQKFGDYISQKNSPNQFFNLFTNRLQGELPFSPLSIPQPEDDPANKNFTHSDMSKPIFAYNFPNAKLKESYLVKIISEHNQGLPLKISAVSDNSQNKYFDTLLQTIPGSNTSWFYIPARQTDDFDRGLTFIFNNTSFSQKNQNYINQIVLYPIFIEQNIAIPNLSRQYLNSNSNIFYYKTKLTSPSSSTLVLPQSYSSGWTAFYFKGLKPVILNHTLINNWANGWTIPESSSQNPISIHIFFWPQLLESLGFILLLPLLFWLLKPQNQLQDIPLSSLPEPQS
ncbi:MAG TPA: hypothetical protein VN174_03410 [Candidatus Methanoperedens sp.]|nr:hypothetical protein [Candidatus Methanoperedens sp.]